VAALDRLLPRTSSGSTATAHGHGAIRVLPLLAPPSLTGACGKWPDDLGTWQSVALLD
jgi:hypothetical protein